ncbi:hypothetical protein FISHEDRAFT_60013 [Fistulina hepatica ATCC 64428]|uniref:Uncharacterized protein n=1 Tax=Fistulina hepatica ATCC 64428 TaxID=1128425 RepID=A0A0D7A785_9AGAR|nr:hypothetical protein FISHEDRAFT_60013 [Fistulina hepatica ATCC 64428]
MPSRKPSILVKTINGEVPLGGEYWVVEPRSAFPDPPKNKVNPFLRGRTLSTVTNDRPVVPHVSGRHGSPPRERYTTLHRTETATRRAYERERPRHSDHTRHTHAAAFGADGKRGAQEPRSGRVPKIEPRQEQNGHRVHTHQHAGTRRASETPPMCNGTRHRTPLEDARTQQRIEWLAPVVEPRREQDVLTTTESGADCQRELMRTSDIDIIPEESGGEHLPRVCRVYFVYVLFLWWTPWDSNSARTSYCARPDTIPRMPDTPWESTYSLIDTIDGSEPLGGELWVKQPRLTYPSPLEGGNPSPFRQGQYGDGWIPSLPPLAELSILNSGPPRNKGFLPSLLKKLIHPRPLIPLLPLLSRYAGHESAERLYGHDQFRGYERYRAYENTTRNIDGPKRKPFRPLLRLLVPRPDDYSSVGGQSGSVTSHRSRRAEIPEWQANTRRSDPSVDAHVVGSQHGSMSSRHSSRSRSQRWRLEDTRRTNSPASAHSIGEQVASPASRHSTRSETQYRQANASRAGVEANELDMGGLTEDDGSDSESSVEPGEDRASTAAGSVKSLQILKSPVSGRIDISKGRSNEGWDFESVDSHAVPGEWHGAERNDWQTDPDAYYY